MKKFKNNTFELLKNEIEKDNYSVSYRNCDELSNNKNSMNQTYFDDFNNKIHSKNMKSNKRKFINYENQNKENLNFLKSKYYFYNMKYNRQLIYLKNELELLKDKSTKSKEKMTLFIKLVKKYAKKLLTLSKFLPFNSNMNNNENNIFTDIIQLINLTK